MFINTRAISSLFFFFWLAKISDLAKSKFKMAKKICVLGGFSSGHISTVLKCCHKDSNWICVELNSPIHWSLEMLCTLSLPHPTSFGMNLHIKIS